MAIMVFFLRKRDLDSGLSLMLYRRKWIYKKLEKQMNLEHSVNYGEIFKV